MITTKLVEIMIFEMMSRRELLPSKWKDTKYEDLKNTSTTKKGNLAEDLLVALLRKCELSVFQPQGRRDHYDILISKKSYSEEEFKKISGHNGSRNDKRKIKNARNLLRSHPDIRALEVKCATEDTSGAFQFNGIRMDSIYTHCYLFGISPDNLYFRFIPKSELNTQNYHLVSMARGSNATFKLTRNIGGLGGLIEFNSFNDELNVMLL